MRRLKMDSYDALLMKAKELEIPINSGIYKPKSDAWSQLNITEYELHRRIKEEQRNRRDSKLFWIALLSTFASILSAAAALLAVYLGK